MVAFDYLKEQLTEFVKTFKNVNDLKENLSLIAEKWLVDHILKEDAKDRKVASISVAIRIIRSRREKAIPMHLQLSA